MTNRVDMQHDEIRDPELERRLEAYARSRLSPSPAASARMRAAIMGQASRELHPATTIAPPRRRAGWLMPGPRRRLLALGLAAALLALSAASVAAASNAGGPLYGVRLWAEELTLPSNADARARAQADRLALRLAEVAQATAAGDAGAVAAALEAYRAELDEAISAANGQEDRLAHLESVLAKHVATLEAVAAKVPAQAADAIQNAITRSQRAVDAIEKEHPAPGGPNGNPGGPNGNPGGPNGNPGGPNGNPGGPNGNPSARPSANPPSKAPSGSTGAG
jgi:hypothetical protein